MNETPLALAWIAEGYNHNRRSCLLTEQQHAVAQSVGQATLASLIREAVECEIQQYSIDVLACAYPQLVHGLRANGRQASMLVQPNRPESSFDTLEVISNLRIGHRQRQHHLGQQLGLPSVLPYALQTDLDATAGVVYFHPSGMFPVTEPWIPGPWEHLEIALPSRNPIAHM